MKQVIFLFILYCFCWDFGMAQSFQYYYQTANERRSKGDYWQAIIDYTEAINRDPQNMDCYAERGYCHSRRKNYSQALKDYDQAIALGMHDPLVFLNRAWTKYNLGYFAEACLDWRMAEQLGSAEAKKALDKHCQ